MSTTDVIKFIPEDLRQFEIHPKVAELLNFIVDKFNTDYGDILNKYKNPSDVSEDVISVIIRENGFSYIANIAANLTDTDTNILLNFMSLLHFMKGTRAGLELVLEVLGFKAEIVEWWETTPPGEEDTFNMTVFMDLSKVDDVFKTLERIRLFTLNYVYPRFQFATVVFAFDMADTATAFVSFGTNDYNLGLVEDTL